VAAFSYPTIRHIVCVAPLINVQFSKPELGVGSWANENEEGKVNTRQEEFSPCGAI
jgi:hypothetical protein